MGQEEKKSHNFFQMIFEDKAFEQRVMRSQSQMAGVWEKRHLEGKEQIATLLV